MSEQLNLAQRIAKAAASVGGKLSADKKNKEQNYEYISSDKMLAVIGQALADNGIVVFPAVVSDDMIVNQTSSGKNRYDVRVKFDMTITDGNTSLTMPWVGIGNDYSAPDKATYKAITSGHKYFLAKLFCIGVGNEDGEHESEDKPVQQQQQQQQKTQARKQPSDFEQAAKSAAMAKMSDGAEWQKWQSGDEAKAYAVNHGWCANEFEARNSLLNSLEEVTQQKAKWFNDKQSDVFKNFYDKHINRQSEQKQAA